MEPQVPTNLIIRYLSNEASTEEGEQLLDWIANDSANQKIFSDWTKAWNYQFPSHFSFDVTKGLRALNERIDEYESTVKQTRSIPWARVAVITLTVSVTASLVLALFRVDNKSPSYSEFTTASVIDSVNLPDGSKAILNANSSIKYPTKFASGKREVTLNGEAFFKVVKDPAKPFIVTTKTLTTEVLGTSFNVLSTDDQTTVSVVTGRVKVSDGTSSVMVLPYEKATYSESRKSLINAHSNLAELTWMTLTIVFDESPLSQVAKRLHETYNVSILFENPELAECTLTGKFKNENIEDILTAISISVNAKVRKDGRHYILSGPGCFE